MIYSTIIKYYVAFLVFNQSLISIYVLLNLNPFYNFDSGWVGVIIGHLDQPGSGLKPLRGGWSKWTHWPEGLDCYNGRKVWTEKGLGKGLLNEVAQASCSSCLKHSPTDGHFPARSIWGQSVWSLLPHLSRLLFFTLLPECFGGSRLIAPSMYFAFVLTSFSRFCFALVCSCISNCNFCISFNGTVWLHCFQPFLRSLY